MDGKTIAIVGLVGVVLVLAFKSIGNGDTFSSFDSQIITKDAANEFKTPYEMTAVKNTLAKNSSKIQTCYEEFLKAGPQQTAGTIFVDWYIDKRGKGFNSEIVQTTIANKALQDCVTKNLNQMRFPPPPSGRTIYTSFKYNFTQSK